MQLRVMQHPFNRPKHTCGEVFSAKQTLLDWEHSELSAASCRISIDNATWRAGCQDVPWGSNHSVILVVNMAYALTD